MNERRTLTNEPENKKAGDEAPALHVKDNIDRQNVSRKGGGGGGGGGCLSSIEGCVNASIRQWHHWQHEDK